MMPSEFTPFADCGFAADHAPESREPESRLAWRPDGLGLAALVDVGLSTGALARYFRVTESEVARWLETSGILSPR